MSEKKKEKNYILLDEDYRLGFDKYNWILEKKVIKKENDGKLFESDEKGDTWRQIGFFGCSDQFFRHINDAGFNDSDGVLYKIKQHMKTIKEMIKDAPNVLIKDGMPTLEKIIIKTEKVKEIWQVFPTDGRKKATLIKTEIYDENGVKIKTKIHNKEINNLIEVEDAKKRKRKEKRNKKKEEKHS